METETKTAIVTGASSGIGLGITQALLERGWRVVATSRAISKSEDLKPSPDLVLIDGDAGRKETAVEVVAAGIQHFGGIDLLVNNAGIFIPKAFALLATSEPILPTPSSPSVRGYRSPTSLDQVVLSHLPCLTAPFM